MLKPQDILVTLKLSVMQHRRNRLSFASLAESLGMSASETHAAVKRAVKCHLLSRSSFGTENPRFPSPAASHLIRFVQSGLPYAFPAETGGIVYGMPTSIGTGPLNNLVVVPRDELPPVWPDPQSNVKGMMLSPLYRSCPVAARNDSRLYELLSLVDAIRGDSIRLRQIAATEFEKSMRVLYKNHLLPVL